MMETAAPITDSSLLTTQGPAVASLGAIRQSYVGRYAGAGLLPLLAGGVLLAALVRHWPTASPVWPALGVLCLLTASAWWMMPMRRLDEAEIAKRLDRRFDELQDSTGLLLANPLALSFLGQLQFRRVARQLAQLTTAGPALLPVAYKRPTALTAGLLLAAAVVALLPPALPASRPPAVAIRFSPTAKPTVKGQTPARIIHTDVRVTPPAYTRRMPFAPTQASFQCPEGSRVRWQVQVSGPRRPAPELELGRRRLKLQSVAGQPGRYAVEHVATASALYRLRYAGTVSDDYALDVRADQAPVLRLQTPKPYTLVAFGTRAEVPVRATVQDDYGLSRAELVITVAVGQGEAVKFREVRRDLSATLAGQPPRSGLASVLNLPGLGLTYGDELYFYIQARDNAGHTARTDAYLVQWQDTAVADSPLDMGMGVKVAPAYFRSQRQIIIDTEKLLKEKARLDAPTLAGRANDLGFDQQTLRLRYGKFMGEESAPGLGAAAPRPPVAEEEEPAAEQHHDQDGHDHAAAPAKDAALPTAATDALMEPYMHRHDDAETADFLEPAVKAKLRAVLDQMWAAELRLRTGQLAAALPFEYRALRLLKQVQQQTRVYVKKAGFVPPPLPEATLRLTGELTGAAVPQRQQTNPAAVVQPEVRAALRWLAAGTPPQPADVRLLEQAGAALAGAALQRPAVYLPALRALRQLVADARARRPACAGCRPAVERALTDLLAPAPPTPTPAPAADRLARRYFQELSR